MLSEHEHVLKGLTPFKDYRAPVRRIIPLTQVRLISILDLV